MRVKHATVLQMNKLVFAASLDIANARSVQGARGVMRHTTFQRGMQNLHALDDCVVSRVTKRANGSLDFR